MSHAIALLIERKRLKDERFSGNTLITPTWVRVETERIDALIGKLPADIKRAAEVTVRLLNS
jgi:hypothetical protein